MKTEYGEPSSENTAPHTQANKLGHIKKEPSDEGKFQVGAQLPCRKSALLDTAASVPNEKILPCRRPPLVEQKQNAKEKLYEWTWPQNGHNLSVHPYQLRQTTFFPSPPKKRKPVRVPEEEKDDTYLEMRRKNNESSKRSKEARRIRETGAMGVLDSLEDEYDVLHGRVIKLEGQLDWAEFVVDKLPDPR